jgi:hypothetical protein
MGAEVVHLMIQRIDLLLQRAEMRRHVLVLLRVLEAIAAVGSIDAFEVQVAAALTGRLAVALDLAAFALYSSSSVLYVGARIWCCITSLHAIEMYLLRFARCCGW